MPIPAIPAHGASWDSWGAGIDAATRAALPKWQPNTAYIAATDFVLNPSGQVVQPKVDFTAGTVFDQTNWSYAKTITAMMNDRSVTENKLNVPTEGTNGQVLTYDSAQAGQMKWAAASGGGGGTATIDTITGLVPNDATLTTATANSATLAAWVADTTRGPRLVLTTPGVYSFYGDIDVTNSANWVREVVIGAGVTLQQTKYSGSSSAVSAYGLRFRGSVGTPVAFTADTARFATTVTVADASSFVGETSTFGTTPGSMVYVYSGDAIDAQGKFTNSALARVVSISGNTLTLDTPLFRAHTVAAGASVALVSPHPSVLVHGGGYISHANPGGNGSFYNSLLRFEWVEGAYAEDIHVSKGGGVGVDLIHVFGGEVNAHVSYLPSNDTGPWSPENLPNYSAQALSTTSGSAAVVAVGAATFAGFAVGGPINVLGAGPGGTTLTTTVATKTDTTHMTLTAAPSVTLASTNAYGPVVHYGYGTFAGGGTRNVKVGGTAHHLRHAFTTGAATDAIGLSGDSGRGDPQFIDVAISTWDTWHQAIDTHEAGHDIRIKVVTANAGTYDDAVQQAQQVGVNIRSVNTTVTGMIQGGALAGVVIDLEQLLDPTLGVVDLTGLTVSGAAEGVRITGTTGAKFRMNDLHLLGCPIGIRLQGITAGSPVDLDGRRIRIDAQGRTVTAAMFVNNTINTSSVVNLRDLEVVGYSTEINFNSSGLSQSNTRWEKTVGTSGRIVLWTGSAWPARPKVPAGEVTYRGPSSATNPSDALAGDILELG